MQITINGKTYCRISSGWIGPDLREPGIVLRIRLALAAWKMRRATGKGVPHGH